MNIQLFYHVAMLGPWRRVVPEQVRLFRRVGLRPMIGVVHGPGPDLSHLGDVMFQIGPEHETPTLQRLWEWCRTHPGDAVLYCHTKGVSKPTPLRHAWRHLMAKWTIERWRENLALLADHDAVGVDFRKRRAPHFSGNFWLARADWINRLSSPEEHRKTRPGWVASNGQPWARMCSEDWLFHRPGYRYVSLCCENIKLSRGDSVFRLLKRPIGISP